MPQNEGSYELATRSDSVTEATQSVIMESEGEIDGNMNLQQSVERDERLHRRTLRKLDFILLPFLSTLFLLNSIDKSNVGNAETAGKQDRYIPSIKHADRHSQASRATPVSHQAISTPHSPFSSPSSSLCNRWERRWVASMAWRAGCPRA